MAKVIRKFYLWTFNNTLENVSINSNGSLQKK